MSRQWDTSCKAMAEILKSLEGASTGEILCHCGGRSKPSFRPTEYRLRRCEEGLHQLHTAFGAIETPEKVGRRFDLRSQGPVPLLTPSLWQSSPDVHVGGDGNAFAVLGH